MGGLEPLSPSTNNKNGLDMQIRIDEMPSAKNDDDSGPNRKWFEVMKDNTKTTKKINTIDVGIINIDDENMQEGSGSGMEDTERGIDQVTRYPPLPTRSKSNSQTIASTLVPEGDSYTDIHTSTKQTHTRHQVLTSASSSETPASSGSSRSTAGKVSKLTDRSTPAASRITTAAGLLHNPTPFNSTWNLKQ